MIMDEYTSMTFAELAEKLGIKHESARKLVKKHNWRRKPSNDGRVLIDVPNDYFADRPIKAETPPETPAEAVPPVPDDSELRIAMARLETEVSGLKELVVSERRRADTEAMRAEEFNGRAIKLESERDEWRDLWVRKATRPWWKRMAS